MLKCCLVFVQGLVRFDFQYFSCQVSAGIVKQISSYCVILLCTLQRHAEQCENKTLALYNVHWFTGVCSRLDGIWGLTDVIRPPTTSAVLSTPYTHRERFSVHLHNPQNLIYNPYFCAALCAFPSSS